MATGISQECNGILLSYWTAQKAYTVIMEYINGITDSFVLKGGTALMLMLVEI